MDNLKKICNMIAEYTLEQVCNGIDKIDAMEMGEIADIIKDLEDARYHAAITDSMEKSDNRYEMDLDEYRNNEPKHLREMDRNNGIMYYTEPSQIEHIKSKYMESKQMGDQANYMNNLEEYMRYMADDLSEMMMEMDNSEKTMVRTKLQTLAQRMV